MASVPVHAVAAALCALWAVLIPLAAAGRRPAWLPAAFCLATSAWAASVAVWPVAPLTGPPGLLDLVQTAFGLLVLLALGRRLGGPGAVPLARAFGLAAAALLPLAAGVEMARMAQLDTALPAAFAVPARLALALLVVLVAENIIRNLDEAARWHANLPCIVIGGMAAFDLVLLADAALSGAFSAILWNARGALWGIAPALLVLAALRDRRWKRSPAVSREVVFHGATLVIAGAFLLGVGGVGEALRHLDADWGGTAQVGLLAGALMALAVALSSRSFRSRIRRSIVDHFFAARYDYRREWMRATATLSAADEESPAPVRAIRAIADAVDVPGGILLTRSPDGALVGSAFWNAPDAPVVLFPDHPVHRALAEGGEVLRLDPPADGDPLAGSGRLWLAVPLLHHREGLTGAVLLAPPRAPFPLDEEVNELLGTLGRAVAMFLAERQAAERLADSRRLADYAKRFAFVAHDVKTVSNQLTLMLANAEANLDDPEFQRDLLTTMRSSVSRINTLIARLRQEDGAAPRPTSGRFAVMERLRALARNRAGALELVQEGSHLPLVAMPPESFDAAVTHLLDNAIEASPPTVPVRVVVRPADAGLEVDIIDRGPGMSETFIRNELFRPMATSKPGGSGIGAWQARELLAHAGGRLDVLSRPGEGTTMRLRLPAGTP
jgi:putative PEP-CTERM system histidine kinase